MSLTPPKPAIRPSVSFSSAARSDVGKIRDTNEDAFILDDQVQFWVVADGMGGHASGQVASRLAVEYIADFMTRWRHEPQMFWPFEAEPIHSATEAATKVAIQVANLRIYNRSQVDAECEGMGTTVVLLHHSADHGLVVAHVGDSRCYRLRDNCLERLTEDHSLAGELTRSKLLTEQEAKLHAGSNIILRALGIEDDVQVDVNLMQPMEDDLYLICSDGLTDLLSDYHIESILQQHRAKLEDATEVLVAEANRLGGNDNITAALVRVDQPADV